MWNPFKKKEETAAPAAEPAKNGRNTQAIEIYKRLIINHPTNKLASRAQGRLNRLQK